MMRRSSTLIVLLALWPALTMRAQTLDDNFNTPESGMMTNGDNRFTWGREKNEGGSSSTEVPIGVTQFTLSPLLGEVVQQEEVDTLMYGFQKLWANHEGDQGQYSHTGAYGSPRLSRLYMERRSVPGQFLFLDAYDYFRPDVGTFRFTNTKCPITNMSLHRAGSSSQGNDRLRAYFASNINRRAGIGFLLDYLYARGQYNFQQNSMFNGSVYGYYHGDQYQMNALIMANHAKMAENGGITDDEYIRHPENFERSFTSRDIPTQLSDTWNRNDDQTYYLSHRYNFGYYRHIEAPDTIAQDSLSQAALLAVADSTASDSARVGEFVPVASIIHTFKASHLGHRYSGHRAGVNTDFYGQTFLPVGENVDDHTFATSITNTLGLSLREGFRPWVKAGLTAFATHESVKYTLPDSTSYRENNISVGGTFARTGGRALRFNATGQVTLIGELAGDFNLDGTIDTRFRLLGDTCALSAHAFLRNDKPNFFFRHFHGSYAWWDNSFDQEVRTRIEGAFRLERLGTRLNVGVENITNYTYLATTLTPNENSRVNPFAHTVAPKQAGGSVQVVAATLQQHFRFGIFNWEHSLTYQKSSRQDVLPLPDFNYWTDIYIKFRIAKVLNMQIGADMRYFTRYEVPDYSPVMNAFTTQDSEHSVKLGGYPIMDAYLNMHIKHFRFYLNVQHVNESFMKGDQFLTPHYPIDPMVIHFGLSWNFFN